MNSFRLGIAEIPSAHSDTFLVCCHPFLFLEMVLSPCHLGHQQLKLTLHYDNITLSVDTRKELYYQYMGVPCVTFSLSMPTPALFIARPQLPAPVAKVTFKNVNVLNFLRISRITLIFM